MCNMLDEESETQIMDLLKNSSLPIDGLILWLIIYPKGACEKLMVVSFLIMPGDSLFIGGRSRFPVIVHWAGESVQKSQQDCAQFHGCRINGLWFKTRNMWKLLSSWILQTPSMYSRRLEGASDCLKQIHRRTRNLSAIATADAVSYTHSLSQIGSVSLRPYLPPLHLPPSLSSLPHAPCRSL